MAEAGAGLSFSALAAEDIDPFLCVVLGPSGVAVSRSSAGEGTLGVSQDRVLAGQALSVQFVGVSKVQAGGLFDVGALLTADSNGQVVEVITTSALPLNSLTGVALTASSELDTIVYALLLPRPSPYSISGLLDSVAPWWQA
jgi:hypothetical protein